MRHPAARFVGGRLGGMMLTLLLTSFIIFMALYAAPGNPESFLLQGRSASPQTLEAVREQYHLDQPVLTQFSLWLGGVVHGDFGRSIQFRQDVGGLIAARLPTTLLLVVFATSLMLIFGLLFGTMSALRPGAVDKTFLLSSTLAVATPTFIAAVVLIGVFAVQLGWFPTFGNGDGLSDRLHHLVLPASALSAPLIGLLSRVTRASMLVELSRDHVDVARGAGHPGAARRVATRVEGSTSLGLDPLRDGGCRSFRGQRRD
ncbi:MAG: ABC transporter permease [Nocardioidaceae bacterium]